MKKFFRTMIALLIMTSLTLGILPCAAFSFHTDVTDEVQMIYVLDAYDRELPIVRADAVLYSALDYTRLVGNEPGCSTRTITVYDWAFRQYFDDAFLVDMYGEASGYKEAIFEYDVIWLKDVSGATDAEKEETCAVYTFSIPEKGKYEFVFVMTAQQLEGGAERGFRWAFDGSGEHKSVYIKPITFDGSYLYEYSYEEMDEADGRNDFYQMGYVYGITGEFDEGEHTITIYNLPGINAASRPNLAGFYVEKWLTPEEFENYKYPSAETEPEKTETEPEEPVESEKITVARETTAPETTAAPAVTTAAPDESTASRPDAIPTSASTTTDEGGTSDSGCGSVISAGALMLLMAAGIALTVKRKRHDTMTS